MNGKHSKMMQRKLTGKTTAKKKNKCKTHQHRDFQGEVMSTSTSVHGKTKNSTSCCQTSSEMTSIQVDSGSQKLGTCLTGWFSTSRTCTYYYCINDIIVELYARFEIFHFHTLDPNKLPLWPPNPNIKDFIKDGSFFSPNHPTTEGLRIQTLWWAVPWLKGPFACQCPPAVYNLGHGEGTSRDEKKNSIFWSSTILSLPNDIETKHECHSS